MTIENLSTGNGTFSAIWFSLLFPLLLLELHVPIMHHSSCQLVNGHLFIRAEAQDVHSTLRKEWHSTYLTGIPTEDSRHPPTLLSLCLGLYLANTWSSSNGTHIYQHYAPHSNTKTYGSAFPLSHMDSKDVTGFIHTHSARTQSQDQCFSHFSTLA